MSSISCVIDAGAKVDGTSKIDCTQQTDGVSVQSSISMTETLKNAQVENWLDKNEHSQCDTAHVMVIPRDDSYGMCSLCTGVSNSPCKCNSQGRLECLMVEITDDPIKRAQLEALPATSVEAYMEYIKQNPHMSDKTKKDMLEWLEAVRKIQKKEKQSLDTLHVLLQHNGDSEIVFTSPVKILLPINQYSESVNVSGENIKNYSASTLVEANVTHKPMTENKSSTATVDNDETLNPYMKKPNENSNSITHNEFKQPHEKFGLQDLSNSPVKFPDEQKCHVPQRLSASLETFAALKDCSMKMHMYLDKPITQKLKSKNKLKIKYYPYDSARKLKDKLVLHGSSHVKEGCNVRDGDLSSDQVPSPTTQDESERDATLYSQCNSTNLDNSGNWEELSELDEEPLTQESSSSSM